MKLRTLSKSDIKLLNKQIFELYSLELFNKKDNVQKLDIEGSEYIKVNDEVAFFYFEKKLVPTIKLLLKNNFLKRVVVDMGSIKFLCNGADVLRPGIVKVEESISKNDTVSIVDEKNNKCIAIGKTLYASNEINSMDSGKVIKNIHYVGDNIWSIS
ncbi:RNA-binding protein [Candidatus Woesearchaeota archaeon]|nr:RNA-binding protein [Candidatus Woesearchaeota archaeon]